MGMNYSDVRGRVLFIRALVILLVFASALVCEQTPETSDSSKSWTASAERQGAGNVNPTRSTESHTESNGRTVDKQAVERMGPDGRYEPYLDIEKESVKVDANTVRTVERTFGRDSSGQRVLVQLTEEENRSSRDGAGKSVRTTSNPDANGRLQVVQREIQETKKTSPDTQDKKTTVFTPDVNGGLAAVMQSQEHQKRSDDHTIEFRKSTSLPDGNGGWQVGEVKQGVIKGDGKERTTDEQVLRPDNNGTLSPIARTVSKESQSSHGENRTSVDTYTTNLPGSAGDGSLQLEHRVTTLRRANPGGGQTTEKQVEGRNPGDPGAGLRLTTKAIDIVRPGAGGATETQTVQSLDANGNLGAVSVDIGKTNKPSAINVDIAPSDKPKQNPPK